jgi:hypothetical protein
MRKTRLLDMGGPDMGPHTPQRSERPGQAVALLEVPPSIWTFLIALLTAAGCRMLPRADSLQPILRPHDAIYRPSGSGPFPAVVLLHGCAGMRRKDTQWAEGFREQRRT